MLYVKKLFHQLGHIMSDNPISTVKILNSNVLRMIRISNNAARRDSYSAEGKKGTYILMHIVKHLHLQLSASMWQQRGMV